MAAQTKNAEKWTIKESEKFLIASLELAKEKAHDFIGEVARDMDQYRELYTYLVKKFPTLKPLYNRIIQECETNCFSHGKKGDIVPSLAIMNLKSNHKWTDRVETDITTGGEKINIPVIKWIDDETGS